MLSVGVTLLPMLAGLVTAFFAVGQLSSVSQHAIRQVAAEAKNGLELLNQLSDLERSGKAYLSLRDAGGFNDFKLIHQRFDERLQGLLDTAKTEGNPLAAGLEALAAAEKTAFETMVSRFPARQKSPATAKNSNPHDLTPESDPYQSVKAKARELTFGYAAHIEEGFLLAGKACVGKVFGSSARAHCYDEVRRRHLPVGRTDIVPYCGRHLRFHHECLGILGYSLQCLVVLHIEILER